MSISVPRALETRAGRAVRTVQVWQKLRPFLSVETHPEGGEKLERTGEGGVRMLMPRFWYPFLCFHFDSFTYTSVRPSDQCVIIHRGLVAGIFSRLVSRHDDMQYSVVS